MKSFDEVCKELDIAFDNYKNNTSGFVEEIYNKIFVAVKDGNLESKENNLESFLFIIFDSMSKEEIDDVLREINNLNGDKDVLDIMRDAARRAKDMKA
ncbi:MAG: hypothetical protein IKS15_02955 [Opitutales bacterium]|nr:hypothetical protein [Opitutales bacterium]